MGQSSSDLRGCCDCERSRLPKIDNSFSRPVRPSKHPGRRGVSFTRVGDIAVPEEVSHELLRDTPPCEQMSCPTSSRSSETTMFITPPSTQDTHNASLPVSPALVFGASHLKRQASARWQGGKRELRTVESPNLAWLERGDRSQGIHPRGLQETRLSNDSHALVSKLLRAEQKHLQDVYVAKGRAQQGSDHEKYQKETRRWKLLVAGVDLHQNPSAEAQGSQTNCNIAPISMHETSAHHQ